MRRIVTLGCLFFACASAGMPQAYDSKTVTLRGRLSSGGKARNVWTLVLDVPLQAAINTVDPRLKGKAVTLILVSFVGGREGPQNLSYDGTHVQLTGYLKRSFGIRGAGIKVQSIEVLPDPIAPATMIGTAQTDTDSQGSRLLRILLDPETKDEDWNKVSEDFQRLPAELRIRELLPIASERPPQDGAYNCYDPRMEHSHAQWGRYCVAQWLWCKSVECFTKVGPIVSSTLVDLVQRQQSPPADLLLLDAVCYSGWTSSAEAPIATKFRDASTDMTVRTRAADCLLRKAGPRYYLAIREFALQSDNKRKEWLFRQLVSYPVSPEVDPIVVKMGFSLLDEELKKTQTSQYGAFLIAYNLGRYVRVDFEPDPRQEEYKGAEGNERLYGDTVASALKWWSANQLKFKPPA